VTLGNPFGPYAHGRIQVNETLDRAAANYRDGKITNVELVATYTSGDLACVIEAERGMAKVGGGEELVPLALRVTSLFRHESGTWKLVHRHADTITTARSASSVINRQPLRIASSLVRVWHLLDMRDQADDVCSRGAKQTSRLRAPTSEIDQSRPPGMSDFAPLFGDTRTSDAPNPSVPIYALVKCQSR